MKLNLLYLIGLVCCMVYQPSLVYAQDINEKYIDSVIETSTSLAPEKKRKSYLKLGDVLSYQDDPKKSNQFFDYFFEKDTTEYAKMFLYEGYSRNLSRSGFVDESIRIKLEGIRISEKLKDERRIAFYNISIAYSYDQKNKPNLALQHLTRVEDLVHKEGIKGLLPNFYQAKSDIYNSLKDYKSQEKYLLKTYDVIKDIPNNPNKRFYLYLILDYYTQVDNPAQLAKFTEIMAQHYEDANVNTPKGHMPIASLFKRRLSTENIPVLQEAIHISDSLNSINSFAATTMAIADIYEADGQTAKGIAYLESAVTKLKTVEKPSLLIDMYTLLARLNATGTNYKEAYNYKLLQASLQDSITSEKMQRNIAEIEIAFETEKKERKIAEQQLELERKSTQNRNIQYGLIVLGIIATLLLFFYRSRLKAQKTIAQQTQSIQAQQITELQQKNKLLALNSMIEGQEAERLRIAKDLHDSLGGLLSTVKAHFTSIQNEIEQIEAFNLTEKTNKLIDEAVVEVRRISHNMMPQALSISGLKGAVEDLGVQLQQDGYTTNVELLNLPNKIDPTKEVMMYRLLQELLSNIRKHANATTITIELIGHENEITVLVEDDGKGFNYNNELAKEGLGLKSVNSRVQYLDGTIEWDTKIGRGTSVLVTIPLAL